DRDLAAAALAEANRHHRGADARADVNGAVALAFAIKTMNVFMAADSADRQLVQASDRDLTGVRVPRQDERNAVAPQAIGLFGDVRQPDGRKRRTKGAGRARDVGMA